MFRILVGLICLALAASGCYKNLPVGETDTIGTFFDADADFAGIQSYFLPDSVVHIGSSGFSLERSVDALILARVAANLDNVGYRRVADLGLESADVLVLVYAVNETQWDAFRAISWWAVYSWVPGLDAFRGVPYQLDFSWRPREIYTYDGGSLFLVMVDLRRAVQTESMPAVWLTGISGLVVESPARVERRAVRNIDQAFVQSPYLRGTP